MNEEPDGNALPVLRVVVARRGGDCSICCLAMILGVEYEDILAVAVSSTGDDSVHYGGLYVSEILNIAKLLGVKLHRRKKMDLDSSCGILSMYNTRTGEGHVVVLKSGLIFDVDGTVWDPDCFLVNSRYEIDCLLTLN